MDGQKEPGLLDVTRSILWAMLGVQKSKNYERDFQYGKPWQYVLIGVITVAIFIFILVLIVNFAISASGN